MPRKGRAAEQIVVSRVSDGKVVRSRPLCPYPQVARYTGEGSMMGEKMPMRDTFFVPLCLCVFVFHLTLIPGIEFE